ncbi:hypothetical protein M2145_002566 [Lachnospiraceae bacterium PF1-21]
MAYVGKSYIIDIIQNKQSLEDIQKNKMDSCVNEINAIETELDKDDMYGAFSLGGKPTDTITTSRSNNHSDLNNILEQYQAYKANSMAMYTDLLMQAIEEIELINQVWRIYLGLEHRLFMVFKMLYEENEKWETVCKALHLSNRQISDHIALGVKTINYELKNGIGSSNCPEYKKCEEYLKVYWTRSKEQKNSEIDGQLALDIASNE